jgi:hypothetical protein
MQRALVAGGAWGITMSAGLVTLNAWECGAICLTDAALTSVLSVATGICTIGPLAAWGGARSGA